MKVPEGTDPHALMQTLTETPGITHVEPAFRIKLAQDILDQPTPIDTFNPYISPAEPLPSESISNGPNDPFFDHQSHFAGIIGEELDIDETWSRLTHSPVIVAIIDSGIDYDHVDLKDNIWTNIGEIPDNNIDDDGNGYIDDIIGYDFQNDTADAYDEYMHGTHIAGIIGAVGNNGIGVTGILWDVQLMGLRFTDESGIGNTAMAIEAIHYAVNNGARVINLSWTVTVSSGSGGSQVLENVIKSYSDDGVIFLAAAGNGDFSYQGTNLDESPLYPASISSPNLISVAASDINGDLADYSNYGTHSVHIVAPGSAILSTLPGNQYGPMTGTSAATGLVSAAAALILTEAPDLNAWQVKNLLMNTVNHNPNLAGIVMSSGSLNLYEPLISIELNKNLYTTNPDFNNSPSSLDAASSGGCSLATRSNTTAGSSLPIIFILIFVFLAMNHYRLAQLSD